MERLMYISLLAVFGCILLVVVLRHRRHVTTFDAQSSLLRFTETMLEGFLGLDANGRIVEVNTTYLKMSGYRRSDLVGRHIESLVVSTQEGEIFERMKRVKIDKPARYRGQHRTKDGSLMPLEVSVVSFEEGKIAFICFYRDLREQMKAEAATQHTLEFLRYVIEHTRSAVAVFDEQMRYLFVSEAYKEEYRIPPGTNIIGLSHYEVIIDIPLRWKEIHQRALAGEVLSSEEDAFERLDGSIEYTRWECRPWYGSDGSVGGMVLYAENITAQKEFEQELVEARDYLSALITQANAPIVVWNEEFTIVRTNPAFAKLFGKEVGHLVGQHIGLVKEFVAEADLAKLSDLIAQKERIKALEVGIRQADGSVKTVLWTAAGVFADKDRLQQTFIAQGQDISDRQRVEEENRNQLAILQRWYAVMAHREERIMELKGEVNALLGEAGRPIRYNSIKERVRS